MPGALFRVAHSPLKRFNFSTEVYDELIKLRVEFCLNFQIAIVEHVFKVGNFGFEFIIRLLRRRTKLRFRFGAFSGSDGHLIAQRLLRCGFRLSQSRGVFTLCRELGTLGELLRRRDFGA